MTAIIIRLKTLLIFGAVLVVLSFVWLGATQWEAFIALFADEKPAAVEMERRLSVPVVTVGAAQEKVSKDNFFSEFRIERERTRSGQIEILREIVNNPNSSEQLRQEAQHKLIAISDNLDKESKIENMLVAKGFKDAIAVIQEKAVMVIVPSDSLLPEEAARIADIVTKMSGVSMENVTIVPKAL
ncbi:MAG: SpoIIIAH-like family protein [Clostridia bacterium]|jgi:stage III sporulation protein AH|nr:SpoIIIAH-like family protein [Clostridia bacterium]